ncbi:MAG: hypothetical protein HON48_09900 [Desulfobacula sp.]|nr:hypothetical protein [Desulfobacula sp.]
MVINCPLIDPQDHGNPALEDTKAIHEGYSKADRNGLWIEGLLVLG